MTTDTSIMKAALDAELQSITTDLQSLGIHDPQNTSNWIAVPNTEQTIEPDPNVSADRAEDWDERRATLAVLETRYNNIVRALNKIAADTYGFCEVCNEPITPERLHANPAARTCQDHLDADAELPT